MIAKEMIKYVEGSSAIRAMFEEGKKMADIYGVENVFDFSLGNPNLPPPPQVAQAIIDILQEEEPMLVHGYMNNSGYEDVRESIAKSINKRFGTEFAAHNILMTVGAAGGLNVIFKVLLEKEDQVMAFAPYFGEYKGYAELVGAELVSVTPNPPTFQPNLLEFEEKINERTKIVMINSPNNPTGVVYTEDTLEKLAEILNRKQKEYGTDIYLISDEPYRELAYDGVTVPYVTKYYKNTIVGYSYSKSLSLPGQRIGYVVMPDELSDSQNIIAAANVVNRILGFVNAPSLMQRVIGKCLDTSIDVEFYNHNRSILYKGLMEAGYECVNPQGAFYLFVKSPIANDVEFCAKAKEFQLLVVPGSAFGCPGYFRIAYCVHPDKIARSIPKFQELIKSI